MLEILMSPVALIGWALLATLGLLWTRRVRGLPLWWAAATAAGYFWLASPLGANLMVRAVEGNPRAARDCPPPAAGDVVVALAGGVSGSVADGDPPLALLKEGTFRRTVAAVALARDRSAWLLVSGGGGEVRTEADLMRELAVALGAAPERVLVEAESRSTRESAARVAERVGTLDAGRVHLVTSALHMPRAAWAFAANGLPVCRHPVDWKQVPFEIPSGLVPQSSALDKSTRAVREVAGQAWYRLSDR